MIHVSHVHSVVVFACLCKSRTETGREPDCALFVFLVSVLECAP